MYAGFSRLSASNETHPSEALNNIIKQAKEIMAMDAVIAKKMHLNFE